MSVRRLRQDLDHATSVLLLLSVLAACVTGFLAHVWDLNDFARHTWSGYAMAGLATAHVALNLDRLVTYWTFRSRQGTRLLRTRLSGGGPDGSVATARPVADGSLAGPAAQHRRRRPGALTRRALLTTVATTVGGLVGWAMARRISVTGDPVGNDAGMVYHRLSRPA